MWPDEGIYIDKEADWWQIIYPLRDITLRVRIRHTTFDDPDLIICELQLPEATAFYEVAHFDFAPVELSPTWDEVPDLSGVPLCYRPEFILLLQIWERLTRIVDFGPALGSGKDRLRACQSG